MREEAFHFSSKVDGLEISCLLVAPDDHVRATVLMAHGIMEYKERYLPLMRFLAENGFACAMNDHRGYGKSVKAPEDNGYTYGAGAKGTLTDFETLAEILKARYPGEKMYLYGHSMGALIAINHLKKHSHALSGAVLSGLPENNAAAGAGKKYLKLKKLIKGDRFRDEAAEKLMFKAYSKPFPGADSPHVWINSNPERVREYDNDPLAGQLGTVDGYLSLLDLLTGAYDGKGFEGIDNLLSVRILVGEDDPCAGGRSGSNKSCAYLKKAGFANTTVKQYGGMRHEIHNEDGAEEVYRDILNAFT